MQLSLAPGAGAVISSQADLRDYLTAVAAGGFDHVSLGLQQVPESLRNPDGFELVSQLLTDLSLRCRDVMSLALRRDTDEALATAEQLAALAGAVGAEHVLVLFFTRVRDESIDALARIGDVVGARGARVALEFAPASPISTVAEADAVVGRVGADRAGVLIDTFHFFRGGSTWAELDELPLDHLALVQFDDALPAESDDVMHETTNRRAWPGQGEFDLARFSDTVRRRGWSGVVSVEVLSEELRRLDTPTYARLAHRTTAPYWS
jgi:sugar phosphate isomerase/epimerase